MKHDKTMIPYISGSESEIKIQEYMKMFNITRKRYQEAIEMAKSSPYDIRETLSILSQNEKEVK